MKYLLDTSVIIRSAASDDGMQAELLRQIAKPGSQVYFSHISLWEISIKVQIGRLDLALSVQNILDRLLEKAEALPILLPHILGLQQLPTIHRDPFDRLLIAQAKTENMILVTSDRTILSYPIRTLQAG